MASWFVPFMIAARAAKKGGPVRMPTFPVRNFVSIVTLTLYSYNNPGGGCQNEKQQNTYQAPASPSQK